MVLISVITVNKNNAAGLEKTISSVTNQSFSGFEFIVIDGNSSDTSKEIITLYKGKINYWVSEPDAGIYQAMNKGIAAAKGKFLLFLNSGDTLLDAHVLSKVSKELNDTDIVTGDLVIREKNGNCTIEVSPDAPDVYHMMFSSIWHPAAFIQKKLFNKIGYYREDFKIAGDYDFFVRAIVKNKSTFKHLPIPIALFESDGASNDPKNFNLMFAERRRVQENEFTATELKTMYRLEIQSMGRASRFFSYLPRFKILENLYDRLYLLRHNRRVKRP
jgi:glycosyltransferase involved in cell wall biosynthesis